MTLTRTGVRQDRTHLAFELTGSAQAGSLVLDGPLGTRVAEARWTTGEALLLRAGEATRYADMAALTEAVLGQALPVAALFAWLEGRATVAPPWVVDLTQYDAGRIRATQEARGERVDVLVVLDRAVD